MKIKKIKIYNLSITILSQFMYPFLIFHNFNNVTFNRFAKVVNLGELACKFLKIGQHNF